MYVVSDTLYVILYYLIGYRVEVVRQNLTNAYPEKSTSDLRAIERKFYKYFCDLIFETIKTLTISPKVAQQRITFDNPTFFKNYSDQGKSVVLVMGHLGNWELAGSGFSQLPYHQLFVIYHPLKNKYSDRLIYHMRIRLGNRLYAMKETFKAMVRDKNIVSATAFIADQTPSNPNNAYWTTFLNQDTPVFTGTAKISKKLQYPIVYVSVQRPQRGRYHIICETLTDEPHLLTEDQISELHTRRLEQDINQRPHLWLWTHRRWKHKRI